MASNVSTAKFAPKGTGIRDPRDPKKKNGMFWNPPRFLYFGGAPGPFTQTGSRKSNLGEAGPDQRASGPISDRGQGR